MAADVMVSCPTVHNPSATIAQLRRFFDDEHVHAALLVDADQLIGVIERTDLTSDLSDDEHARTIARLDERTVHTTASLATVLASMKRSERRRLAVVDDNGALLGLLCLRANGQGFCSDIDLRNRASDQSRST